MTVDEPSSEEVLSSEFAVGRGQPSENPSSPLASFGQLSLRSETPSLSESSWSKIHPVESTSALAE